MFSVKLLRMLRMTFLYFLFQSSWKGTISLWQSSTKLITLGKCAQKCITEGIIFQYIRFATFSVFARAHKAICFQRPNFIYCRFHNSKLNRLVRWKMNLKMQILKMLVPLSETSWNYFSNIVLRCYGLHSNGSKKLERL